MVRVSKQSGCEDGGCPGTGWGQMLVGRAQGSIRIMGERDWKWRSVKVTEARAVDNLERSGKSSNGGLR